MILKIFFIIVLIIALIKWYGYRCLTLGLIYYLAEEHNDVLTEDKIEKWSSIGTERAIKRLFRKN